jgi:serine/threonine protein kinase
LTQLGIQFKAPKSLLELSKLNSGLHYGYSQTGKCFTVYPHSDREAVEIADHLDSLTADLPNPTVPFDTRLRSGSAVHYRYGAFTRIEIGETDADHKLAIETPEGQLVEDDRRTATPPPWAQNPFSITPAEAKPTNPLVTRFQVFCVLCQRGKGGVYLAIDSRSVPESVCVIKEGRRDGEVTWDGRDGSWRVRTEMENLLALESCGIRVPKVFSSFELDGNFYLVTEFIQGCSLQTLLTRRKRRLSVSTILGYGIQVAHLLSTLHAARWVWRDCKPSNLCVTREGRLRAIDFEGSTRVSDPRPSNWATPAFSAPELSTPGYVAAAAEDLYALGVLLYYLFSGRYPDPQNFVPVDKVRAKLSREVAEIVTGLLQRDPVRRLSARSTAQKLSRELDRIKARALD